MLKRTRKLIRRPGRQAGTQSGPLFSRLKQRLWTGPVQRLKQERGQSVVLLAFAFIGLVGMLGLALDLGSVYIQRIALKRAIDAAVLGGVLELPIEEDAGQRGLEYLWLNGYDPAETKVYFAGCIFDPGLNPARVDNKEPQADPYAWYEYWNEDMTPAEAKNIFWLDTYTFQGMDAAGNHLPDIQVCNPPALFGTANKLRIRGGVKVDMNFMRLAALGAWQFVEVFEQGTAQNVDNIDMVIVMDRSGSMEFDPVCYGCWERTQTAAAHETDIPRWAGYYTYPYNGLSYPVGFNDGDDTDGGFGHPRVAEACEPNPTPADAVYRVPGQPNVYYMAIEAELYSLNPSPVSIEFRASGKGYWALQRGEGNYDDPTNPYLPSTGFSIDARGAHMAHHPSSTFYPPPGQPLGHHYTLAEAQTGEAPVLIYDFKFRNGGSGPNLIDWTGDQIYIFVRVHGGRGVEVDGNQFIFPLYGDQIGADANATPSNLEGTKAYWAWTADLNGDGIFNDAFSPVTDIPPFTLQPGTGWRWVRLNASGPITANADPNATYQLHFYAGSSGFSLDQIVVTNDANPTLPVEVQNQAGGSLATKGSASRAACDPCNVIYGEDIGEIGSGKTYELDDCNFLNYTQPVNHSLDPLFGEWESPLRPAKESFKRFVNSTDPERDQVGLVSYSETNGVIPTVTKTELECLRRYGVETCAQGTNPFSFTQVLKDLEDIRASSLTNIGAGMKAGLEVLGIDLYDPVGQSNLGTTCGGSTCARRGEAQQVMIMLTDGVPNANPGGACQTDGPTWTGDIMDPDATQADYDCPLYFAQQAAQEGVIVHVIGFGYGIQPDYLQAIADLGHGKFFFAASQADIDVILDFILADPQSPSLTDSCDVLPIVIQEDAFYNDPPLNTDLKAMGTLLDNIREGFGSGNFGWVRWQDGASDALGINTNSEAYLAAAIDNPSLVDEDYINPTDLNDTILNTGDWVWAFGGQVSSSGVAGEALTPYLNPEPGVQGGTVLLPVWDIVSGTGSNLTYHIIGFARLRLTAIDFLGNPKTLSFTFAGWDTTCRPNN